MAAIEGAYDGDQLAPLCLFPGFNPFCVYNIFVKRFCFQETTNQSFSFGTFFEQIKLTFKNEKGNLLTDIGYFTANGIFKTTFEYILGQILVNTLLPNRQKYSYIDALGKTCERDQPQPIVVGTKLGCFLFVKSVFYPIDSLLLKFLTKTISFTDIPRYFTSFNNLKSLYCGFQYQLAYELLFGIASSVEQILYCRIVNSTTKFGFLNCVYSTLALFPVAIAPLTIKANHDQVGIDYSFTWHIPFMRRILFIFFGIL